MKKTCLIFDFDGTIADSTDIAYQVYETLAYKYGFDKLTKEEINELQALSIQERLKRHKISIFKLPRLARKTRKIVSDLLHKTYPFDGMSDLLSHLKAKGYTLTIVSSNSKQNIMEFMDMHDLPAFDLIKGKASFFGKERLIKKVIKKYPYHNHIYIGDELRDIVSCQNVKVPIISVTWGFDDATLLEAAGPDCIVDTMEQLESCITSFEHKGEVTR